jgi:hypothetical protein
MKRFVEELDRGQISRAARFHRVQAVLSSILRFSKSLSSITGVLVLTRPRTALLPLGRYRNGSKSPARSVSYSKKKQSQFRSTCSWRCR